MERLLYKELLTRKSQGNRKPLLLQGARQAPRAAGLKKLDRNFCLSADSRLMHHQ